MKKMNLVKVMNEIECENATMALLLDKEAFWNITSEQDDRDAYDNYKYYLEDHNEGCWDMIEWLEKNGKDYTHWADMLEKPKSYEEWLAEWQKVKQRYMAA